MNSWQRKILLAAFALFALSELFPPWVYEDSRTSRRESAGYHFLSRPPAPEPDEKMREIFSIPAADTPHHFTTHLNEPRQYLQRTLLAFLTLGWLILTIRREAFVLRVVGIMTLICAGGFLSLLVYLLTS